MRASYLNDSAFLKKVDEMRLKEQRVKIISLSYDEKVIDEIQGKITNGSISLSTGTIRRTGSVTFVLDDGKDIDILNLKNVFAINKKIKLEIGIKNDTMLLGKKYYEYDYLWFPLGVYGITDASISRNSNVTTVEISLKDKMCFLDGTCGGVFPASIDISAVDKYDAQTGERYVDHLTYFQIIQELVNHWGKENLSKIIINDVPLKIKRVLRWESTENDLYAHITFEGNKKKYSFYTEESKYIDGDLVFEYGRDIGYEYTYFTYSSNNENILTVNAGSTITSALDELVNKLGNYEYYYDLEGNFVFQEIKNYLNTSKSSVILEKAMNEYQVYSKMSMKDFIMDRTMSKAVYVFDDSSIITTYTNNPSYENVKNDFVIWGARKTADGESYPIHYRLSIETKPELREYEDMFFFEDEQGVIQAKKYYVMDTYSDFPDVGEVDYLYMSKRNTVKYKRGVYQWKDGQYVYLGDLEDSNSAVIKSTDFRTELYLRGALAEYNYGNNYYDHWVDLKEWWPRIYDIKNNKYKDEISNDKGELIDGLNIDYYLDFIEPANSLFAPISVEAIGRRTYAQDFGEEVNCIFMPAIPEVIILKEDELDSDETIEAALRGNMSYSIIDNDIATMTSIGGRYRSAHEKAMALLYQYGGYNEQISISSIPIFYLDVNTRITVNDSKSGIYGDYIINSISIPLGIGETMSISATRALSYSY